LTPTQFAFLTDENIHPEVIAYLRGLGVDVATAQEANLISASDALVLSTAVRAGRVVLTHDRDFGSLAVAAGQPVVGIVYLRPGHIDPEFTIDTISALFRSSLDPVPPFLIATSRSGSSVRVRLRKL